MQEKLKVLDLFSGIGGFSLGLERAGGFETVAFCEIDLFCQRVLKKHWPRVPIYDDVRTLDYGLEKIQSANVITAGFPCQDISYAGAGAGLSGERSGLWWKVRRAIRMVRPRFALLENVAALLNRGMGEVLGSLAAIGYDTEWNCIPAGAVGAPHFRDRAWIVAYPQEERQSEARQLQYSQLKKWISGSGEAVVLTDDDQKRGQGGSPQEISGFSAFSWCKDVRRVEDLRERPDLPPPLFRGSRDGIPDWVDRIGSLGNAVVPQIPEMIGRAILVERGAIKPDRNADKLRKVA